MDEFRQKVIDLAKRAVSVAPQCLTEQAVNISLVLPFIHLLGYDDRNPQEVCPEHHADFSERYKNRVDFAILKDGIPIIAIECKQCGAQLRDDRGQLRSYFNAAPSVKMGVLTDGLIYEFYADSDEPNMMDQSAFLTVNLTKIAEGHIEDNVVDGLRNLQKLHFDPVNIGNEAKRNLIFRSILVQLDGLAEDPDEAFVRLLLQNTGMTHLRAKAIEEYRPTIREAFREFINLRILKRLSLEVPVKTVAEIEADEQPVAGSGDAVVDSRIVTTETELALFDYVKRRLAFLVKEETAFEAINSIQYRDYQGKFVIYYQRERAGRMFDFIEGNQGRHRILFPADKFPDAPEMTISEFSELDDMLLKAFLARFEDRSIKKSATLAD